MNRAWIAAILAFCLVVVVGSLAAGGIIAATAGRDLSPAAATMVATIAGGILAAVATYIGGKDYEPPAPVVIPEATDAIPEQAAPIGSPDVVPAVSPDDAGGAMAVPVVADPVPLDEPALMYEDDESTAEDVTDSFRSV